jgi:hypothetical protein
MSCTGMGARSRRTVALSAHILQPIGGHLDLKHLVRNDGIFRPPTNDLLAVDAEMAAILNYDSGEEPAADGDLHAAVVQALRKVAGRHLASDAQR